MKNMTRIYFGGIIILSVITLFTALGNAAVVINVSNPDFENTDGSNHPDDWYWSGSTVGPSGDDNAFAGVQAWNAHSGVNSFTLYGWRAAGWAWLAQDIAYDCHDGQSVTFSLWALMEADFSSEGNETYMKVEFKDGGIMQGSETLSIYNAAAADRGNWNQYNLTAENTFGDNIDSITIVVGGGQFTGGGGSTSFFFDNISLTGSTGVPEPTSALIFLCGTALILMCRPTPCQKQT